MKRTLMIILVCSVLNWSCSENSESRDKQLEEQYDRVSEHIQETNKELDKKLLAEFKTLPDSVKTKIKSSRDSAYLYLGDLFNLDYRSFKKKHGATDDQMAEFLNYLETGYKAVEHVRKLSRSLDLKVDNENRRIEKETSERLESIRTEFEDLKIESGISKDDIKARPDCSHYILDESGDTIEVKIASYEFDRD